MHPLKVLHIIWSTDMGGISKVVLHLCEEQQKDDSLQVSVFCAKGKSELYETFQKKGIHIYEGKFTSALSIKYSTKNEYHRLMSKFDIIHFHSFNPLLASIAKKSGKKIIYTEHGNFGFGRKMKINDIVVRWLKNKFLNKDIHAITFNSKFTMEESISRFGLITTKKEVVYNGVPENSTDNFTQNQFRKSNHEYLIASIGRLAKVKRFDRLINTISKIKSNNFKLILMGTGPEESELKKQVRELNLTEKVLFAGQGNSIQLLHESNICVIPSQGEAFGLVAIEAYQQGKQVLVFENGGGVTELVKQIDSGAVLTNEIEMAEFITKLIQDSRVDPKSMVTRKEFASQFSMKIMTEKIKEIYSSL